MTKPILVVGATGGLGRQVVLKLLAQEKPVRILVRNFESARSQFTDEIEYITGDVREPSTLTPAMDNARAVVCCVSATQQRDPTNTSEHVDYDGVRHLVEAALEAEVARIVLVSWQGVPDPNANGGSGKDTLSWKQKGEDIVRSSGLLYTIIRPGRLTDGRGGQQALRLSQGDKSAIDSEISREDVAEVIVRALNEPAARNVTFEVVSERGEPPKEWGRLFARLKKD